MSTDFFLLLDAATIIAGIAVIVAPNWIYNSGKPAHEKKEISPKTKWGLRIFGVVVVACAALYLYIDIRGRL